MRLLGGWHNALASNVTRRSSRNSLHIARNGQHFRTLCLSRDLTHARTLLFLYPLNGNQRADSEACDDATLQDYSIRVVQAFRAARAAKQIAGRKSSEPEDSARARRTLRRVRKYGFLTRASTCSPEVADDAPAMAPTIALRDCRANEEGTDALR